MRIRGTLCQTTLIVINRFRKLLEICDRHSKDFLGAILPDGVKDLYKQTLEDYNKHYKYSGKV